MSGGVLFESDEPIGLFNVFTILIFLLWNLKKKSLMVKYINRKIFDWCLSFY